MAKLAKLTATIGQLKYHFKSTDNVYEGDIATDTGISPAGENDLDAPEYSVKELIQAGILRRVTAYVRRANNTRGVVRLLVAKDKLETALDSLKGNTITLPTGVVTIVSVGFPRRVISRG